MAAIHKKNTASNAANAKREEPKEETVVVSDTVTETTERIEVIKEVTPDDSKSEEKTPAEPAPAEDPLTEFKEKMNEEEEQPVGSESPQKNFMWPILFVFIIALAILGGIFIYKQGVNKSEKVNVVSLSPSPTLAPEPTKAAIDLTKYTIKILNGSEVEGEAGRQKDNLEGEGFTVSSIGNAVRSDYAKTIIQAKEDVDKDFLDKLKSVLEESFIVGEIEDLPEDADFNVVIIIGSETN